eukprot:g2639.t1
MERTTRAMEGTVLVRNVHKDEWDDDDDEGFSTLEVSLEQFLEAEEADLSQFQNIEEKASFTYLVSRDADFSPPPYRPQPFVIEEEETGSEIECMQLKIISDKRKSGFEPSPSFALEENDPIAGRFRVTNIVGSGAFATAIECVDLETGKDVCLKCVENKKEYFDQSISEIRMLRMLESASHFENILQLKDAFYFKEHLFLCTEMHGPNLYEFREENSSISLSLVRDIARQLLGALAFVHKQGVIHCDIKPENVVFSREDAGKVILIDFGSACFLTDIPTSYVASRAYRAPELLIGAPYDAGIDVFALGAVLAEFWTGNVLFQSDSAGLVGQICRMAGILGEFPPSLLRRGCFSQRYFTSSGHMYSESAGHKVTLFFPKQTSLTHRLRCPDQHFIHVISSLLAIDMHQRPTASQMLRHVWFA